MPARATTDISHEQSVDHDIERIPASLEAAAPRTGEKLLAVGGWSASDRELGLAYGQMAGRGDRQAGERALALLVRAEAAGADDPALHAQLGFLRQVSGDRDAARSEYLLTLKENPFDPLALSNLAVLDATGGSVADATALLDRLITADPTQTRAGLNLAFIECRLGQPAKALATLATLAQYNLDDPSLRTLKERGNLGGQHCDLPQGEPAHAKN
jgi:Flp pilus assembly protein TadD